MMLDGRAQKVLGLLMLNNNMRLLGWRWLFLGICRISVRIVVKFIIVSTERRWALNENIACSLIHSEVVCEEITEPAPAADLLFRIRILTPDDQGHLFPNFSLLSSFVDILDF